MARVCETLGCPNVAFCKCLCRKHYQRFMRHGSADLIPKVNKGREFVEKVAIKFDREECLVWPFSFSGKGYNSGGGYPTFSDGRATRIGAHRLLCELRHGPAPSPRHEAAHSCGNSRCVNPHHVSWKTPEENAADKIVHQTHMQGEHHWNAKLSAADVACIRSLHPAVKATDLAKHFGVSKRQIYNVISGTKWASV